MLFLVVIEAVLRDPLEGFCSGTVSAMSRALVRMSWVYVWRLAVDGDEDDDDETGTSAHVMGFRYERASWSSAIVVDYVSLFWRVSCGIMVNSSQR